MSNDPRAQFDALIVGAGVVGLAVARAFAMRGFETLVVERHEHIGAETSSRNSGVIHSGIYYPTGSLKARLCVEGRKLLYEYAESRGIAHRRCGKLIVAQDGQTAALDALYRRGVANGVATLQWLSSAEARALEPEVRCAAALVSPDTGIVDGHELMVALQGDLETHGGHVALHSEVQCIEPDDTGSDVRLLQHDSDTAVRCRYVVNCAGLDAVAFARRIRGYPFGKLPIPRYAKGSYFSCPSRPFSRLVYPMPNEAGLGIHATLDLAGNVRFGPDVEWIEQPDYEVHPRLAAAFEQAIREYWPGLPHGVLRPDYAGIRPKVCGPGDPAADFLVDGPERHGIDGVVNLLGIESPGLTASLALADHVIDTALGRPHVGATTGTAPA
jgi:L-2-hydroxyglutarate oxidase LhgO